MGLADLDRALPGPNPPNPSFLFRKRDLARLPGENPECFPNRAKADIIEERSSGFHINLKRDVAWSKLSSKYYNSARCLPMEQWARFYTRAAFPMSSVLMR